MTAPRPGPRNALSDVAGIQVGSANTEAVGTGVTVIGLDTTMRCAVDVRGGGPATRETPAVSPDGTLGIAHAIVLSGGSVFGLAAADEVTNILSARGVGFCPVPETPPVPIVPAASLYDLANKGNKAWGETPPYRDLARAAVSRMSKEVACGSVGAGFGATAGTWLGGLGTASIAFEGYTVAALVAINSIGSPIMPDGRTLWAWPFEIDAEFGGRRPSFPQPDLRTLPEDMKSAAPGQATCIGVVATSHPLGRDALRRVAIMAQDGLARAIRPSHAPFDGDTLFGLCSDAPAEDDPAATLAIGSAAADCVARAVGRAVWHADAGRAGAKAFQRTSP